MQAIPGRQAGEAFTNHAPPPSRGIVSRNGPG